MTDAYIKTDAGVLTFYDDTVGAEKTLTDLLNTVEAHKTEHQNGGGDEINVGSLSGLLADAQTPLAHKNSHDPEDGSDALDTAAPSAISGIQSAGIGTSHSLARSDHIHEIAHSIANNKIVTMDDTDAVSTDYAKFTANGLQGRSKAEILSDLNVEDGAEVTSNAKVNAAGATMNADTNVKANSYVLDEDAMGTDSDEKLATQQSIKAFVEAAVLEESMVVTSLASDTTPNPARTSKKLFYELTALAGAALFSAPSGTPQNGDQILFSITDNGTGRALTYNAIYDDPLSASDFPTTTTANKTLWMLFMYSTARTKWELLWTDEEA